MQETWVQSLGGEDPLEKEMATYSSIHAKMATIQDRNSKDLIETEEIKKRWQEITELYKKGLNDPDNHSGVITDIPESEVKWALGSITMNKASEGDGIPAELFKILKDDAVKVLHSVCPQIWKTQQQPQDWKRSSNPKEELCQRMFKPLLNCAHFTCQ